MTHQKTRFGYTSTARFIRAGISVAIKRSIEEAAASFTLEVVAPRKTDPPPWMYLESRAKCKVTIGPDTVVSGYIDKASPEIDATTFRNTVEGRDKTADVIDCDAQGGPEWRDAGLEEIARAHCRPFGVDVVSDLPDNPTIKLHRLQQAETGLRFVRTNRARARVFDFEHAGR